MTDKLTVPQKLLLAALEARKKSATITAEDLVVQAWKLYPDTFGLLGYGDQYPDSNRVLKNIMGTEGMRGKGWLRKVGEKQYRLTSAGLKDGEDLLAQDASTDAVMRTEYLRAELDRGSLVALDRLVSTGAARKILDQTGEHITFHDACGFWDITARSNANTLNARLASTTVILERASEILMASSAAAGLRLPHSMVTREDIQQLAGMHKQMQSIFKAELDVIRKRTDERLERKARPL
jgi:hypothetical protein